MENLYIFIYKFNEKGGWRGGAQKVMSFVRGARPKKFKNPCFRLSLCFFLDYLYVTHV